MNIKQTQAVIEAILFTMGDSVALERIASAIDHDADTTRKLIHNMMDEYEKEDRGVHIIELEDNYQMCTKKNMYEYLIKVTEVPKQHALTDIMLETLSIIAYKQPVTKAEIEKIRGVQSDGVVNRLVEFGLVEEVGRLKTPGRPVQFGTTEDFLRRFGIQSLDDLPELEPEQVEAMKEEAEEEVQLRLDI